MQELAAFQKMEDQVQLTVQTLERDGFEAPNPAFHCIVAEKDNAIVGYAIYFFCYSTFLGKSVFCEDLYVQDGCRKLGVGRRLIAEVGKVALAHCARLDFHVISWNPAVKFYEKLGAVNFSDVEKWSVFRFEETALLKLVEEP